MRKSNYSNGINYNKLEMKRESVVSSVLQGVSCICLMKVKNTEMSCLRDSRNYLINKTSD